GRAHFFLNPASCFLLQVPGAIAPGELAYSGFAPWFFHGVPAIVRGRCACVKGLAPFHIFLLPVASTGYGALRALLLIAQWIFPGFEWMCQQRPLSFQLRTGCVEC